MRDRDFPEPVFLSAAAGRCRLLDCYWNRRASIRPHSGIFARISWHAHRQPKRERTPEFSRRPARLRLEITDATSADRAPAFRASATLRRIQSSTTGRTIFFSRSPAKWEFRRLCSVLRFWHAIRESLLQLKDQLVAALRPLATSRCAFPDRHGQRHEHRRHQFGSVHMALLESRVCSSRLPDANLRAYPRRKSGRQHGARIMKRSG